MLPEEVLDKLESDAIKWVEVQFPDINGNLKAKHVNFSKITTRSFTEGIEAKEMSGVFSPDTYSEIPPSHWDNIKLALRGETYSKLPWSPTGARMIARIKKDNERYLKDFTYPLERVMEAFENATDAQINVRQKIEFYFVDGASIDVREGSQNINLPTKESTQNPSSLKSASPVSFAADPNDTYSSLRQQVVDVMESNFNYPSSDHGHSKANGSQQYINLDEMDALKGADAFASLKMVSRYVGMVSMALPTFMALPFAESSPNDYAIRFGALRKGLDIFSDEEDEFGLSQEGYYFIGGILDHLPAISIFTNPTINSYKRLWVLQKYISAGLRDNHNAIYINKSRDFSIELLFPDPLANPYLALAAIIAAGLDGIKKKKSGHVYKESPSLASKKKPKEMPYSFIDAFTALESDSEFLSDIFTEDIIYAYTRLHLKEYKEANYRPTAYEYERYFHL